MQGDHDSGVLGSNVRDRNVTSNVNSSLLVDAPILKLLLRKGVRNVTIDGTISSSYMQHYGKAATVCTNELDDDRSNNSRASHMELQSDPVSNFTTAPAKDHIESPDVAST